MTAVRDNSFGTDPLVRLVAGKARVSIPASRQKVVACAIRGAMERRGIADAICFVERIGRDRDLTDELIAQATVGETYFFRDPAQFKVIRSVVLPALFGERPAGSPIRIWSAGCSTGEEPYSLAMLAEEEGLTDRVAIVATDISGLALKAARQAEYGAWSFRTDDAARLKDYFSRRGDRYRLERRLARRVCFSRLNLGADDVPSPATGIVSFDLILCRNVLMYLEAATARRVARQLFDCLGQGGWLVIGPSDPPVWKYAPFEGIITPAGVICRRSTSDQIPNRPACRAIHDHAPAPHAGRDS